jgi:hypothetical protein
MAKISIASRWLQCLVLASVTILPALSPRAALAQQPGANFPDGPCKSAIVGIAVPAMTLAA